jgi:hypothetical protein
VDCAILLEGGQGCTYDNLSVEVTSADDAFFVDFMVCGYYSCILLLLDVSCGFNARLAVFYSTTALLLMFHALQDTYKQTDETLPTNQDTHPEDSDREAPVRPHVPNTCM